ncbi:hypothetical protein MNB_SV-6-1095 [hydrothermal vent metagenome]|uniref:Uncharacterized protein n=1 Tax=hydrothermal vent metagenome TaxID=652676 RepID=A0A1W1BZH2_9ZZZZ
MSSVASISIVSLLNSLYHYFFSSLSFDLRAKIYKLKGSKYDKEGDFLQESYRFEETTCDIVLDFEQIFKRFR